MRARSSSPNSWTPLIIVLVLIGVFGIGVGLAQFGDLRLPSLPNIFAGTRANGPLDRSTPTRLTIPAIDLRAKVTMVGKADDGSIATPDDDPVGSTGWYDLGPSPGEMGTAVIVGHVDTKTSGAVFAKLNQLTAGSTIQVRRADWKIATFTVDSMDMYPKTSFPANKVFARSDRPRLALITCGGQWLGGTVGYASNLIVMATETAS